MSAPYESHLNKSEDLITTREEIRAGFVASALEKNRRAIPYVAEARALKAEALKAAKPLDLMRIQAIRNALLTAAGLSDKALSHLDESDKDEALRGLIEQFLEPAGNEFVEELVYRFLLIRGDSLGGSMRNLTGYLAEQKFKQGLAASLRMLAIDFTWQHGPSKQWLKADALSDIENLIAFNWKRNGSERSLVFNKKIPAVKKNIDVCLVECGPDQIRKSLKTPPTFIALGELKGGIDPAGADEHWKTARSALERIIDGFGANDHTPKTFFIGAAIETAMSQEIWNWLKNSKLSNAANLTKENQVASLCNWLCQL